MGTFVPFSANNILDLAKLVSPVLSDWLRNHISALEELGDYVVDSNVCELPNIVICDYYHTFDFVELIKQINIVRYKRTPDAEISPPISDADDDGKSKASWVVM